MIYDTIIIGGGVSGTAVARELSRYTEKLCVVERCEDVCCGTSKANSAIVHAGFDAKPGSLMAKLNVAGSKAMAALSRELDFPYQNIGSLVLCWDEAQRPQLEHLYRQGLENGVEGLEILSGDQVRAMEPHVTQACVAALWAPSAGIVCPFGMTFALAENAARNGAEFRFDTTVTGFARADSLWQVQTDRGILQARTVVNAAGIYAARLHNLVSSHPLHITPRKGEYCLLDKQAGSHVSHTIFQLPGKLGKGVLVTPTVHGNLLLGPTATDIEDFEGVNTTAQGLEAVLRTAALSVDNLPTRQIITAFAGLRAHEDGHEFILGEVSDAPGFFDCAGIESPGLSSAPAIGVLLAEQVAARLGLSQRADYVPTRKGIVNPAGLSFAARQALVQENPAYGQIICRCESVTEGEILDAIRRTPGARSLDGVKRRTRAGMGRCQGGFCAPRVMELLSRELGVPMDQLTKAGGASRLLVGINKDSF